MVLRAVQWGAGAVFGVSIATIIPFVVVRGTQPSGAAVLYVLYGVALASALIWVLATTLLHHREKIEQVRESDYREPRNRRELKTWLDLRIEELVAWRATLDEETAKPVPNINVTESIETMFWGGLNNEVHRKLHLLAPEWIEYWGESPDWFFAPMTRITSEQIAEFSRMLGWSAERLRHIKHELP